MSKVELSQATTALLVRRVVYGLLPGELARILH